MSRMKDPDNLEFPYQAVGKRLKMLREPFERNHPHAGEDWASVLSEPAHFRLACEEPESLFGGPVEA